jgi:high-affinity iron transporter
MRDKWQVKLAAVMDRRHAGEDGTEEMEGKKGGGKVLRAGGVLKTWMERYAMFVLPFITVLREGIEAIVFIAGVTFSAPATAVPLPVVVGLAAGAVVGFALYK